MRHFNLPSSTAFFLLLALTSISGISFAPATTLADGTAAAGDGQGNAGAPAGGGATFPKTNAANTHAQGNVNILGNNPNDKKRDKSAQSESPDQIQSNSDSTSNKSG
jgi:hypothetical protein